MRLQVFSTTTTDSRTVAVFLTAAWHAFVEVLRHRKPCVEVG